MAETRTPLSDAITVLKNVEIDEPSARPDTEHAAMRVDLALGYLELHVEQLSRENLRRLIVERVRELEPLMDSSDLARHLSARLLGGQA